MDKLDILLFILIICVITGLLLFFKRNVIIDDIKSIFNKKQIENFQGRGESFNLKNFDVSISKNLFIGFDDSVKSDNNQFILKDAAMGKFQDAMKNVDLEKGNIFIQGDNGEISNTRNVRNICLGGDGGTCMDNNNLKNFDDDEYPIPVFKRGDKQVYYNNDQPLVNHDKLCFKDTKVAGKPEKCITKKHFDIMVNNNAIKLKLKNSNNNDNYEHIKPHNVEFGQRKGFSNVLVYPFHMPISEGSKAKEVIEGSNNTCYGSGGRQNHTVNGGRSTGNQYYFRTETPFPNSDYSHIHRHTS